MKKPLGIALMVAGLAGIGLGFGYTASSSAAEDCLRFRAEAVAHSEQAVQAGEGSARAQELMAEAESATTWADGACDHADVMRRDGLLISGGGLLLGLIGFFVFRAGKAAAPPAG